MKANRKIFYIQLILLIAVLCLCGSDANAADSFFSITAQKATKVFKHTKGIILVVGGFGLVGIAYKAIFGKVKWDWMAGLSLGLFVLAAVGGFAQYVTEGAAGGSYGNAAGGGDIFATLSTRAANMAAGFQQVAFALGGFGVIMFTFLAICGKINFKHLGYIFICMFMLSGTGLLISYMVGGQDEGLGPLKNYAKPLSFTTGNVGDTYTKAASSL